MKHNYLFLFMALAAILVVSTSCDNSSEASNADANSQHSTQNTHDDQSNADSQNNAASAETTDTNTNDANNNKPNKAASDHKPDQEKDTSATNTDEKKQAYLKQLNETEKEMEKRRNNLGNHSTYALKGVEGNRFDAWDDLLNDVYGTLEKQLSEQEMESLRQEQREWISDRDDEAKEASLKYEGGTQEQLEYAAVKADITKERCYELVEDYMN